MPTPAYVTSPPPSRSWRPVDVVSTALCASSPSSSSAPTMACTAHTYSGSSRSSGGVSPSSATRSSATMFSVCRCARGPPNRTISARSATPPCTGASYTTIAGSWSRWSGRSGCRCTCSPGGLPGPSSAAAKAFRIWSRLLSISRSLQYEHQHCTVILLEVDAASRPVRASDRDRDDKRERGHHVGRHLPAGARRQHPRPIVRVHVAALQVAPRVLAPDAHLDPAGPADHVLERRAVAQHVGPSCAAALRRDVVGGQPGARVERLRALEEDHALVGRRLELHAHADVRRAGQDLTALRRVALQPDVVADRARRAARERLLHDDLCVAAIAVRGGDDLDLLDG